MLASPYGDQKQYVICLDLRFKYGFYAIALNTQAERQVCDALSQRAIFHHIAREAKQAGQKPGPFSS